MSDIMPTRFFNLLAEMRDMIYDYLWLEDTAVPQNEPHSVHILAEYFPSAPHIRPEACPRAIYPCILPSWLFTSKTMLKEAHAAFARHGKVDLNTVESELIREYNGLDFVARAGCKSLFDKDHFPPLLSSHPPRRLVITVPPSALSLYHPLGSLHQDAVVALGDRLGELCDTKGIKEMSFEIPSGSLEQGLLFDVELGEFAEVVRSALPLLDRLEVVFVLGEDSVRENNVFLWVEEMLGEELKRVEENTQIGLDRKVKGGLAETRVYSGEKLWGWSVVWTRCL